MRLFVIMLFMVYSFVGSSVLMAQEGVPFRKLDNGKLQRVVDNNIFWKTYNLDRIYFAPNGVFKQQLNSNDKSLGDMYTGAWFVKNDLLCWKYDDETRVRHKITNSDFCYSVYSNSPDETFMTTHGEEFILYQTVDGIEKQNISFEWNRWAYDDYILEPAFVATILDAMDQMKKYREARSPIVGGTINRNDLNDRMKEYYDMTIGKIFFVGDWFAYFDKKGNYFSIGEKQIEDANGDISSITTPNHFGKWLMKDNIHCYARQGSKGNCEFVVPKGQGLMREYEGILGFHNNGFSRVHGEMAVGHIDPSDSSYPELIKEVERIFSTK